MGWINPIVLGTPLTPMNVKIAEKIIAKISVARVIVINAGIPV
jgi:hypothetical protein